MKFGRMVDLGGQQISPVLVNFGPGVRPRGQNVKNVGNAHLVD